ncbi:hypothetical protein N431DRAFT_491472 [Stipitochalara longipes BDJ]|nr:hypothetical protein N431DRAFT_491472 [Stipitochalara longipes BDJ]
MGEPSTAVADLVVKLHSNIDSIHQCIQSLSDTSSHDAELERLATERETKIAELRQEHEDALKELALQREDEARELAEQRRKEEEELEAQRQREYEELMARRKREDEERAARLQAQEEERARLKKEEDEKREQERLETERSLQEKVEAELERLEDEMERKVEEGKRALRELDEKRKAINEQIDRALNTPSVIPTMTFRSRAKTLRSEQNGMPKATSAAPIVEEQRATPAQSETKSTDAPREVEMPAADEAKDTPIELRAEYDNPPQESKIANKEVDGEVVEKDAEALETQHAVKEEEIKPTENPTAAEAYEGSPNDEKVEKGAEEHEQTHGEDEAVGTNAVSIPESTSTDTAEASELDTQEPHPEVDHHETQDGHESDYMKPEDVPDRSKPHVGEAAPASEDRAPNGSDDTEPEAEKLSPLNGDAQEIHSDAHPKDPRNLAESHDVVPATQAHEAEKELGDDDHVPEDEQATSTSDRTKPIADEDAPPHALDNAVLNEVSPNKEQDRERPISSEETLENPGNKHVEASGHETNISDSAQANQHVHNEGPAHSDETAVDGHEHETVKEDLDEVEAQTAKRPTTPSAEAHPAHEEKVSDEHSSPPAKQLHREASNAHSELKEAQDKEAGLDVVDDAADQSAAAPPLVAWWEKGGQPATPAQTSVSESSLLSRSPPRVNETSVPEPAIVSQHSDLTGLDISTSETQEHLEAKDHPETEHEEAPAAHAPTISEEHFDETTHLSDIDEENERPERTAEVGQGTHDYLHGAYGEHLLNEVHSPPILNNGSRGMGWSGDDRQPHVEEKEVDSDSETVEHAEDETENTPHEHEQDPVSNEALDHHLQRSTLVDHTHLEPELKEQEPSYTSTSQVEHTVPQATEQAGSLQPVGEESLQEGADQEHDVLDEYASSSLTPHAEGQLSQDEPSWSLPHPKTQETQPAEHEALYERPTTPTQHQSTYDFAPSTPQHLIQEEHNNSLAESPATVLDADNLFEDSDEEEDEQPNADRHDHDHDTSQDATVQPQEQIHEAQSEETNEETTDDAPETRAFFASLVSTIRPDISLLRRLANQEPSPASHRPDDDHSVSEYSQATPGEYYTPGIIEPGEHFPPQEPEAGLHIRTDTADTVPSFESYAHSDDASTPTTPSETASSPFVEDPHEQPTIRSSWQDNSALQGSDPTEEHHELKPQASPLQGEFDPYNTQTYPNYISPKASSVSLRTDDSRSNSFSYSGGVDPPRFSTQSSISTPPPVPVKSPRLSPLNTSQASQFSTGRAYDSPVSATRSHHESESPEQYSPTQSRIPRRPTDRTIVAARTPVSSPSIPSNSFFQKTRSLFESASQSPSPSAPTRPLSSLFAVRNSPASSPSPPRRNPNRPSSLLLSPPGQDEIVPRSLDKDGKPPSPVFTLPAGSTPTKGKRLSYEGRQEENGRHRNSNPFLDGLSKLVGSGGLEDSMHNPNRRLSSKEKEPLLKNAGDMDGY